MKKLLMLVLAFAVIGNVAAFAQGMEKDSDNMKMGADKAPLKSIKGTIKADGDKVMFVADSDQKSWDIMNPEAVKGHEGHHVEVSAHVYADKMAIHVMKVKMMKDSKM
ncbi:MAG TPA: hypothetical protein VH088_03040 [Terriglobales bacterium]|jgi:hypothetical protein|nr:hypothetical protein [Terriglobales bacterium]